MAKTLLSFVVILLLSANVVLWQKPDGLIASYILSLSDHLPFLTSLAGFITLYAFGLIRGKFFRIMLYVIGVSLPITVVMLLTGSFMRETLLVQPLDIFIVLEMAIISLLLTQEIPVENTALYRIERQAEPQELRPRVYQTPSRVQQ